MTESPAEGSGDSGRNIVYDYLHKIIPILFIIAGIILMLASLPSLGAHVYTSSGTYTDFSWEVAFIGGLFATVGIAYFTLSSLKRSYSDRMALYTFRISAPFLVLIVLLTFIILNPLASPYEFIRDSDLDGYPDDRDFYPDNPSRHTYIWPYFWYDITENSTSHIVTIYNAFEDVDTCDIYVHIWVDYESGSTNLGRLDRIEGTSVEGVGYIDNAPFGVLGENDVITARLWIDTIYLSDDYGYIYDSIQLSGPV